MLSPAAGLLDKRLGRYLTQEDDANVSPSPVAREAITRHLYDHEPVNGVKYQSSLIAVLGDARAAAGRDRDGWLRPGKRGESWLADAAYLGLFDQAGTSFTRIGTAATKPAIHHALRTFSPIQDEPTIEALYALRCSLVHDYYLANVAPNGKNATRTHFFRLTADATTPLVQLPSTRWDGNYARVTQENETIVNLQKVGDLAESVVTRLHIEHEAGHLDTCLDLPEFELRYGICFRVDTTAQDNG
jgi:hypothetical protein